jgi:hypothetical protein
VRDYATLINAMLTTNFKDTNTETVNFSLRQRVELAAKPLASYAVCSKNHQQVKVTYAPIVKSMLKGQLWATLKTR